MNDGVERQSKTKRSRKIWFTQDMVYFKENYLHTVALLPCSACLQPKTQCNTTCISTSKGFFTWKTMTKLSRRSFYFCLATNCTFNVTSLFNGLRPLAGTRWVGSNKRSSVWYRKHLQYSKKQSVLDFIYIYIYMYIYIK